MHCNPDFPADIIPVDIAINVCITAAWERGQKHESELVDFVNVVSLDLNFRFDKDKLHELFSSFQTLTHDKNPTWGEAVDLGREFFYKNPLCFSLWYPDGSIKSSYWHHLFCVIFFHYLPAYVIDGLLVLMRRKPL